MSRNMLWLAVIAGLGCTGKSYNVANPVVGPIPPRVAQADVALAQSAEAEEISQVSYQDTEKPIAMSTIVARVNGKPILAGDILEHCPEWSRLEKARGKLKDSEFRQAQIALIQRDLPRYVEQGLMVDAVRSKLKKEQIEGIEKQLDIGFDAKVQELEKQFKVNSTAELEALFQQQGMSLESMRKMFGERTLAQEYVRAKLGTDETVTRQELLARYESKKKEYEQPTRVKWQQLQISFAKAGGEQQARSKMHDAVTQVRSGVPFTDVVKAYSDGPLASAGGQWDWTQPSSIASTEVRTALETLQPGEISQIIATPSVVQVVCVNERQDAGHKPFGEVQEELRKQIIDERREARAKAIVDELMQTAVVETIFDDVKK